MRRRHTPASNVDFVYIEIDLRDIEQSQAQRSRDLQSQSLIADDLRGVEDRG